MDCSSPVSSVHRIFQVRILEWVSLALQWLERNPQVSLATRIEDWATQGAAWVKLEIQGLCVPWVDIGYTGHTVA